MCGTLVVYQGSDHGEMDTEWPWKPEPARDCTYSLPLVRTEPKDVSVVEVGKSIMISESRTKQSHRSVQPTKHPHPHPKL